MRLTLRTLLAYLDDLLDPEDALELGRRIEENKFATELVHRIRTRTRLLRLGAPKIDGKGIGLDPNTVAEYLDNTLPQERVPEFEKVCLESDVHLAEVASCHHILALVLDKPATVSPQLRERAHRLISLQGDEVGAGRAEPPVAVAGATSGDQASGDGKVKKRTRAAEAAAAATPATSSSSTGWLPLIATVAIVFAVAAVGFQFVGPWLKATTQVARLEGQPTSTTAGGPSPAAPTGIDQRESPAANAEKAAGSEARGAKSESEPTADSTPTTPDEAVGRVAEAPKPAAKSSTSKAGPPSDERAEKPKDVAAVAEGAPSAPADAVAKPAGKPASAKVAALEKAVAPEAKAGRPAAKSDDKEAEAAPARVEVGKFFSEEHILARIREDDDLWYRLTRGTRLLAGDRLVSLPIYRPQIALNTGAQVMLVGEAAVDLDAIGDDATPELSLLYGRMLLAGTGKPGSQIALNLGGQRGLIRLADADTELAVEARKYLPPGSDPEKDVAQTIVEIHTRNGSAGWTPEGGAEDLIPAGAVWLEVVGQAPATVEAAFPLWSEARGIAKLDRDASEQLEAFLAPNRPLTMALGERIDFRKTEVRSLAARSLAELGRYDAVLGELGSDQQHAYWSAAVDTLRAALVRSPESAKAVREAVERLRRDDAKDLYRLLRDFSPEQLEKGGAGELVEYLDHKALDVRVLAYETLRRITGSTLTYRPEGSSERRRVPLQQWRKRLKDGQVVYKILPSPIPDHRQAAKAATTEEAAPKGIP